MVPARPFTTSVPQDGRSSWKDSGFKISSREICCWTCALSLSAVVDRAPSSQQPCPRAARRAPVCRSLPVDAFAEASLHTRRAPTPPSPLRFSLNRPVPLDDRTILGYTEEQKRVACACQVTRGAGSRVVHDRMVYRSPRETAVNDSRGEKRSFPIEKAIVPGDVKYTELYSIPLEINRCICSVTSREIESAREVIFQ
ncbi:uncharacterized protein LOC143180089 [Calliopsis andreniformis]|uniref:uncharacterized protein LOC143180089 n=1 Tax=Calliopsis andreniformis TaxID=337506 RepID=UPI003FCE9F2B